MIRAIAFDLDDTLIDTTGLLVPDAAKQACEAMIAKGYQGGLETCLRERASLATQLSHREIFPRIAGDLLKEAGAAGVERFYNPQLPSFIPLIDGAEEVLQALTGRYRLYLVTAGAPLTQQRKIQASGLESRFVECFTVDGFNGGTKVDAFREIIRREGISPSALLAVGNRLSQEIRAAKSLGGTTCHFVFGEHASETPKNPDENPDFSIERWPEFIPACRL